MIIVADTGPIVHLHWLGVSSWALPPQTIHVVDEIWIEVQRHAPEALQDPRLTRASVQVDIPPEVAHLALDEGERAAISYAVLQKRLGRVLVLCDERAARSACSRLEIPVTGSIGLIIEAARAERITVEEAADALKDLPSRGRLHVSAELIQLALRALSDR